MRSAPPPPQRAIPTGPVAPHAVGIGSTLALAGIMLTGFSLAGSTPGAVARFAALGVGASIAITLIADLRLGLRNVIRADVMALLALYFLTLFEFLFPQPDFNTLTSTPLAVKGVNACLFGFAGLIAGRHLATVRKHPFGELFTREVAGGWMLLIFWGALLVGMLHMLLAVDFNVVAMIEFWIEPRFSQPWARGKFGGWKDLLFELGLLLYLVPPVAGIILARRAAYSKTALAGVVLGLLFVLFWAFSSGTRNVFASYLVTLLIGYAFAAGIERKKEIVVVGSVCVALLFVSTVLMLKFRTIGLRSYFAGEEEIPQTDFSSVFVDYNLCAICNLVGVFPQRYPYLGWEIPYLALIRPIPRAIWKDKPEGLSVSIEEALGAEGLTIAASFVGEAYMSGGFFAIVLTGAIFGALTAWWSKLATDRISQLGILVYASGFFAAVISMRSIFVFSTAILPTIAAIVAGSWIVKQARERLRAVRVRASDIPEPPRPPRPGRPANPAKLR